MRIIKKTIEKGYGRRFAFGDIHGCYHTFSSIITELKITREDQIFLLGDMINRGAYSKETLDYIIDNREKGCQIFPVRGNHEEVIINHLEKFSETFYFHAMKSDLVFMFDKKGKVHEKYVDFFTQLPYFIELDVALLVHAGFNFKKKPFEDTYDMITIREFKVDNEILNGKRIIHGHTPIHINTILDSVLNKSPVINIDNGCVLTRKTKGKGNLVCLNIDTLEIIYRPNIDN